MICVLYLTCSTSCITCSWSRTDALKYQWFWLRYLICVVRAYVWFSYLKSLSLAKVVCLRVTLHQDLRHNFITLSQRVDVFGQENNDAHSQSSVRCTFLRHLNYMHIFGITIMKFEMIAKFMLLYFSVITHPFTVCTHHQINVHFISVTSKETI